MVQFAATQPVSSSLKIALVHIQVWLVGEHGDWGSISSRHFVYNILSARNEGNRGRRSIVLSMMAKTALQHLSKQTKVPLRTSKPSESASLYFHFETGSGMSNAKR